MIKLLIADDFEMVRVGLKSLLAGSDIKVVAEASTGETALHAVAKHLAEFNVTAKTIKPGELILQRTFFPDGQLQPPVSACCWKYPAGGH